MANDQRMTNDQIKNPLGLAAEPPQQVLAFGHSLVIASLVIGHFPSTALTACPSLKASLPTRITASFPVNPLNTSTFAPSFASSIKPILIAVFLALPPSATKANA